MDEIDLLKHMENAMNNSYDLLTNHKSIEELIVENGISNLVFAHNIETNPTKQDIENMLNYFKESEDFEKCIELSKLI
tara:strand:- start:772 stop:1005 length:234 start_codon:yes stop_codon:yes gene_type:complete